MPTTKNILVSAASPTTGGILTKEDNNDKWYNPDKSIKEETKQRISGGEVKKGMTLEVTLNDAGFFTALKAIDAIGAPASTGTHTGGVGTPGSNTNIVLIQATNPSELADMMNEHQQSHNVFASQPMQDTRTHDWVCFLYVRGGN